MTDFGLGRRKEGVSGQTLVLRKRGSSTEPVVDEVLYSPAAQVNVIKVDVVCSVFAVCRSAATFGRVRCLCLALGKRAGLLSRDAKARARHDFPTLHLAISKPFHLATQPVYPSWTYQHRSLMLQCVIRTISRGHVNPLRARRAPCTAANRVLVAWPRTLATRIEPRDSQQSSRPDSHAKAKAAILPPPGLRGNRSAWLPLLEPYLPPHLRDPSAQTGDRVKNPVDVAKILLAAPKFVNGLDLLYSLAVEQQRWSAVVWLVKMLVEGFGPALATPSSQGRVSLWHSTSVSLDEFTEGAGVIDHGAENNGSATSPVIYHDLNNKALFRRRRADNVLGEIWRSLGSMTLACVDGEMRSEILEILAHFHHMEIMPTSIYTSEPTSRTTAIQQPPMLTLLSSNILTSLMDAAWRGHARIAAEGSQAQGSSYTSAQALIPGSTVRTHVVGIRPEAWLDLILWSCIRGGWISSVAATLQQLIKEPEPREWAPLSWKTMASELRQDGRERPSDKRNTSLALSETFMVRRTVSSELVTACVDGLLSRLFREAYDKPKNLHDLVLQLRDFQRFLQRSELNLSTGSWNAVVMRVMDVRGSEMGIATLDELMQLAPALGSEVNTYRAQRKAEYVFDGNAATLGYYHDALAARIKAADVQGAIRVFQALRSYADENQRRSLIDFIKNRASPLESTLGPDVELFTNNFSGIDFPALHIQLPSNILHDFLELLMDTKDYEFARCMLLNDKLDGPIVHESMYSDQVLSPALVRLAVETRDKPLLSKVISACSANVGGNAVMSANLTLALFTAQVSRRHWKAAYQVLDILWEAKFFIRTVEYVAQLARVMMLLIYEHEAGKFFAASKLSQATDLFMTLVYDMAKQTRPEQTQQEIDTLMIVLATIHDKWLPDYERLPRKSHFVFALSPRSFNPILQTLVDMKGSVAGRGLLGIFWPHKVRNAQSEPARHDDPLGRFERQRTVVRVKDNSPIAMYGGFRPNFSSIRIILRKAMEEFKHEREQSADEDISTLR